MAAGQLKVDFIAIRWHRQGDLVERRRPLFMGTDRQSRNRLRGISATRAESWEGGTSVPARRCTRRGSSGALPFELEVRFHYTVEGRPHSESTSDSPAAGAAGDSAGETTLVNFAPLALTATPIRVKPRVQYHATSPRVSG